MNTTGPARLIETTQVASNGKTRLVARYHYADDDSDRPNTIDRPGVKPGGVHRMTVRYTYEGQIKQLTEHGYAPQPGGGFQPISPRHATHLASRRPGRRRRATHRCPGRRAAWL